MGVLDNPLKFQSGGGGIFKGTVNVFKGSYEAKFKPEGFFSGGGGVKPKQPFLGLIQIFSGTNKFCIVALSVAEIFSLSTTDLLKSVCQQNGKKWQINTA